MNYIDILLIVILIFSAWGGITKGFIIGSTGLLAWAGSIIIAIISYPIIAEGIVEYISSHLGIWLYPLSFLVAFIIARIIFSIVVNAVLESVPKEAHGHHVNKVFGIIPGIISGVIWAALIATLFLVFPLLNKLHDSTQESLIANQLVKGVEWVEMKFSPVFDEAVKKTMNKLTVEPGSQRHIQLSYTISEPEIRPSLEAEMLEMVNKERAEKELKPLEADPELREVARMHSKDMFARGYFSHYSPEGYDASYRIRKAGISFLAAGENLALAQTLSVAHYGLMQSDGHRANILNPAFGRVGIGIVDGRMHGLMITQNFRN